MEKHNYTIMYFLDDGQEFGGAANTLLQQAMLMRELGHDVILAISNYEKDTIKNVYYEICSKGNIEICRLPFRISSQPEDIDIVCNIESYTCVKENILKYKPNILHSVQINTVVELVSRELKIPHIMNIYPLIPQFFLIKYIDIFPHYHICDSDYYAKKWKQHLNTDSICIRTVVNKKKEEFQVKEKRETLLFLCVGSIYKEKNQLEVIKAFHQAIKSGVKGKLKVCGYDTSAYAEKCKKYVEENNLQDMIQIVGFINDMSKEYREADVLICGSTRESYPNVISEALSYGILIISTPVGGVPEVIKDGFNGYLCDGFSKESICNKILEFYCENTSDKILGIKKNADITFKKEHSPESVRKNLLNYYQYVLNNFTNKSYKIDIKKIKELFLETINIFYKNRKTFTNAKLVQKKVWYIYHIKPILNNLYEEGIKDIYIWGTGEMAPTTKEITEIFFPEFNIKGFIDTYKRGLYLGLCIFEPKDILQKRNNIIFVGTVNGQEEITKILEENKRIYNKDYFIVSPRRW